MLKAFPENCISRVVKTEKQLGDSLDEYIQLGKSNTGIRNNIKDITGLEADEVLARILEGMSPKLAMEGAFPMKDNGSMLHRLLGEPLRNYYLLT